MEQLNEGNFPTFSQVIHNEVDEAFTGKDKVSVAFEKLHALELEMQKLQTQMLEVRSKYLSFAKGSNERKKIEAELLDLNKKKKDLEKKIQNAKVDAERALANDDTELEDLNLL